MNDDPAPAVHDETDAPPVTLRCGSDDARDESDDCVTAWNAAAAAATGREDLAGVRFEEVWRTVETDGVALDVRASRRVSADRSRLQQLLSNLFRNAVEHGPRVTESTDASDPAGDEGVVVTGEQSDGVEGEANGLPGGPVATVTLGDTDDGFYVADDGPGIPESEREDVFEHGFTTSADGTGFGLSIVSNVADAHGWTVSVTESDAGGARFEFADVDAASDL